MFAVIGKPSEKLHTEIDSISTGYEHVVIDGVPRTASVTRSAIASSDVVVIPVQPSGMDIWSTEEIVAYCAEATTFKPKLKTVFVINRKIVNTAIGRSVNKALKQFDVPILETSVCQRVPFAETITGGTTVLEGKRRGHKEAREEILGVARELLAMVDDERLELTA